MKVNTEVLTDYLNEKCDEKTKQKLEIWLDKDPDSQKYFNELKIYWDAKESRSKKIEFDSETGFQNLLAKKSKRKSQYLKRTLRYAALIATLISTSLFGYLFISPENSNIIVSNMEQTEKTLVLPDGTSIVLAEGSRIEYPDHFSKSERLVTLKGEAFFNVAKNKEKPFVILSGQTRTMVVGTSFRINEDIDRTTIKVRTGIVEFMEKENPKNKTRLLKGDCAQFVNNQKVVLKRDSESNEIDFTVKLLKYNNEKLEVICKDLCELFNTTIQIQNVSKSQLSLSAVFEDQNLESIIKSLCFTLNLEPEQKENIILLK
ncbi:MAG: FecR family protein [Marinifilaceae bacterium]|nr:FecR family protein [Marinifilaceae bacterium]